MISFEQQAVLPTVKPVKRRQRKRTKEQGVSKSKRRRHAKDSAAALAAVDRAHRVAALGGARGMFSAGRESRSVSISAGGTTYADGELEYVNKVPGAARRMQSADVLAHRRRRERERQLSGMRHDVLAHSPIDKGDESTPEDNKPPQEFTLRPSPCSIDDSRNAV